MVDHTTQKRRSHLASSASDLPPLLGVHVEHNTDDHDIDTFAQSYRDAAAYIEAWRADDWTAAKKIEDETACVPCLTQCTAVTAGLLGDQAIVESATSTAINNLTRKAKQG